jgi:gliding motility-associated-like protein
MKYRNILIFILLLSGNIMKAQPPETTYLGTIVYEGYYDDRSWGPLNIGFNFTFYSNTYNRFYVTSNGLVMFGSGSNDYTEDPIPSPSSPNNFIAAFWDDIVINPSGKILYTTIGASPNRKCIIQWTNMGFYASTVLMGTFSVILYEGSNNIQIQYRSIIDNTSARSHGSSAVIGIENSNGTSGIQYAYHNSSAISSEQAILFHSSGSIYTMNSSAVYDGVYLTKNISLPEPGIPKLVSPANNGVIGSSQKFEWTSSSNASYYTLKISTHSDISQSTDYNTGTNTTYDILGLALNSTYYWAVFATNSTGTTWSEIYRFTTSENPPLTAVPQTIWTEQNEERVIRLQYNGGDASKKSAEIIALPSQGSLYQYNAGNRGSQITALPTTLTDPDMNLIYVGDGAAGNGVGNFNFIIHDDTGDSPAGTITINVNPPGIPNFLLAAKSGNIEIQFDKPMADPTGKESQFIVKVNGIPVVIDAVSLKPGDPYTIVVTLETPLTGGETVLISYTQGDVSSESGGLLPSFVDQPVNFVIQTISFPALPVMTYGDLPVTLTATASSGLPVTFTSSNTSVATLSGNVLTANSTGTADIIALQTGNGTYAPARYIRILTVNKADQTVTFPAPGTKTYGDPDLNPGATASSGLPVSYSSDNPAVATISGVNVHITGAGTAIITASQGGNNLYYSAIDVIATLTVNKADQTITFRVLVPRIYGDPDFDAGATTSSSLPATYTSDNTDVATVSGNMIHINGTGSAVITASQAGNENFYPAPDVKQGLVVVKAEQYIIFSPPGTHTYGDPDLDPAATASSGLSVVYSSNNTNVAVIAGNIIQIVGVGSADITASQPGDQNYNSAPDVTHTLIVNKASQVITFPAIAPVVYGAASFSPGASSSSGLTITYSSDNTLVADVIDGNIHIKGAGNSNIAASQAGDDNFKPTEDVIVNITVTKAHLTVTADNKTRPFLSDNPELTYTCSGFVNGENTAVLDKLPTASTDAVTNSPAGDYVITVSGGNDNCYDFIYLSGILTITRIPQTITFTSFPDKLLVNETFELAAVATSGLPVSFESKDLQIARVTGSTLTGISRGNAEIRGYQQGNENYFATEADISVEIISTHKNILYLFTPNNDGFNDFWEIPDLESSGKCEVRVYNRWGKLVFSSPDYHNEWDGTSGGVNLPSASYYFIIKSEAAGTITGTVNIVR